MHLRTLLGLMRDARPVSQLKLEATLLFDVGEWAIEQALSDLENAGHLSRVRAREGDSRRMFVSLTALGRQALSDATAAEVLVGLPKLRREERARRPDSLSGVSVDAKLNEWRRAMRA